MLAQVAIWLAAWTLVSIGIALIVGHAIGFLQRDAPVKPPFIPGNRDMLSQSRSLPIGQRVESR